ncbi:AfsR/SARP family transcriptional regulator, partial [Streptomyces sp. NRRL F-3273]|uniref:AfsR/SARP family transcriptional regulator n=1 Tax=Streptomyces sp. NRRL F-3273 TaxID=1463848 RepID=UPI0004C4C6B9
LHEFDRHFRQARSATAEGRQEEALVSLHAAHALWRGGALADLRGLPTFDNLARQLDERRIEVLERRIDIQLSLGRHKSVVAELYGLVGEHPTWETAHAQLMLALYRSGRVAHALEAYRRVRDSLVHELGLEPGERLRLLHTAILARDPSLDSH